MYLKTLLYFACCLCSLGLNAEREKILKTLLTNKSIVKSYDTTNRFSKEISENVNEEISQSAIKRITRKVSIEGSNLPVTLQVAAADSLKTAYELYDTDSERIALFIALFTEIYPTYHWNAVLDYQHLYYIANYYIRLRIDDDVVFMFSSNN